MESRLLKQKRSSDSSEEKEFLEEVESASASGSREDNFIFIDDTDFDDNIGGRRSDSSQSESDETGSEDSSSTTEDENTIESDDIDSDVVSNHDDQDADDEDEEKEWNQPSGSLHYSLGITPSANHSEPDEEISTDEIIAEIGKKTKTRTELFSLDLTTFYILCLFLLVINAARRFPVLLDLVVSAIHSLQYLQCIAPEVLLEIFGFDQVIIVLEAFGITTASAGLLGAFTAVMLIYTLIQLYFTREERNTVMEMLTFDDGTLLCLKKSFWQRLNFYNLPLNKIQLNHLAKNRLNSDTFESLPISQSRWRKFTEETSWYYDEISKYAFPVGAISLLGGLIKMIIVAEELKSITGCDLSVLITDMCSILGRYDLASTMTYGWLAVSAGSFGFFEVMIAYRLLSYLLPIVKKSGVYIYENWHKHYENYFELRKEDKEKWTTHDCFWNYFFIPFIAGILTYSLRAAYITADEYEAAINCESFSSLNGLIISGNDSTKHACSTSQMIISISGFLSVELSKIWPQYLCAKGFSYLLASIHDRCLSDRIKISRERMQALNKKFDEIYMISKIIAGFFCLTLALPLVFLARRIAKKVTDLGISVEYNFLSDTMNPYYNFTNNPNTTMIEYVESSIFDNFLHDICPFDDLKPKIIDALEHYPQLFNASYPLKILENSTIISYKYAKECPGFDMFEIWIDSLLGIDINCDPIDYFRAVIVFSNIYYFYISLLTGGPYLAALYLQLIIWAFKTCCEKSPNTNEIELVSDDSENENKNNVIAIGSHRNTLFSPSRQKIIGHEKEAKHNPKNPLLPVESKLPKASKLSGVTKEALVMRL